MQIAIRELKAELSRVLSQAQTGEIIEVTSHSRPVARIVGIPAMAEDGLKALMATGGATWSGHKPQLEAPLRLVPDADHATVSRMVLEDRR